jgi:hypothetical protein
MMMRPLGWFCFVLVWVWPLAAQESPKPAPPPFPAVIPLPERPSSDLREIIVALEPYQHLNSWLVEAQVVLWLRQLEVGELEAMEKLIPHGWAANEYLKARTLSLDARIAEALAAHPARPVSGDDPRTALEAGRRAGAQDWEAALAAADKIADPKNRDQFLLGLRQAANRAATLAEARERRAAVVPMLRNEEQQRTKSFYAEEDWMALWPAAAVATWIDALPAEQRDRQIGEAMKRGAELFGNREEAVAFLADRPQTPAIAAMSDGFFPAMMTAARDPESFLAWYEKNPDPNKSSLLPKVMVPLLRRDPQAAPRVLRGFSSAREEDVRDIWKAWLLYDPAAAMAWASKQPAFAKLRPPDLSYAKAKRLPPAEVVDLVNRYPILADVSGLMYDGLAPRDMEPAAVGREILRIKEAKIQQRALSQLASRWALRDSAAALAWARKLPDEAKRKVGVESVMREWLRTEPVRAVAVLQSVKELTEAEKTKLMMDEYFCSKWAAQDGAAALAWVREIHDKEERLRRLRCVIRAWLPVDPALAGPALQGIEEISDAEKAGLQAEETRRLERARQPDLTKLVRFTKLTARPMIPLPKGGNTDAATIEKARRALAELAYPGAPAAANASLCAEVLKLGEDTTTALREDFGKQPPQNARENTLWRLLLERWALSAPEAAARWIAVKGNGLAREVFPLALSGLAPLDAELAFHLADQIPDENGFYRVQMAILDALARRSLREACEAAERHGCRADEYRWDWLRAEPVEATEWMKTHPGN